MTTIDNPVRRDHADIDIRETVNGPDVMFDSGTQGWVMSCTEHDLVVLERALVRRRWAREDKASFEAMTPDEVERAQGILATCRLCTRDIHLTPGGGWVDDRAMVVCAAARPGGPHEPRPS